jgi:hypothetical protein
MGGSVQRSSWSTGLFNLDIRTFVGTLLFAGPLAFVLLWGGALLAADPDWLLHVVYGRAILLSGPWLSGDPTIYTEPPGTSPVLHEWLAEALFALLGEKGSLLFAGLTVAGLTGGLYARGLPFLGHRLGLVLGSAVYLGLATTMTVRPHLFSFLGFVAALALWSSAERRWPAYLVTFALAAVWCNLHGGVLLGGLAIAAVAPVRQLPWALLAFGLGLLVNPWGPGLWQHVILFLQSDAPRVAQDFLPSWRSILVAIGVIGALAATTWNGAWRNRPRMLATAMALAFLALTAHRHVVWVALFTAWCVPDLLPRGEPSSGRAVLLWPGLILSFIWLIFAPTPVVTAAHVPERLIAWLQTRRDVTTSRGYAGYDTTGYLVGRGIVSEGYLHGLTANQPLSLSTELRHILGPAAPGWETLLNAHRVRWVYTPTTDPLGIAISQNPAWESAWTDPGEGTVWLRRSGPE